MIIVAMAFISLGYALVYWGAANAVLWTQESANSSLSIGTSAPPLAVLVGVQQSPDNKGTIPRHAVPFPYAVDAQGNKVTPNFDKPSSGGFIGPVAPKPGTTGGTGGGFINPNYPGGNIGIPTPGIPGTPSTPTNPGRYGTTRPV